MEKYIDAEKLIAKIERLQEFNNNMSNTALNSNMRNFYDGEKDCCKQLLSFIDSLQQEQPEVDLEKEVQAFLCNYEYEFDDDAPAYDIASHFYELGLKARKEE